MSGERPHNERADSVAAERGLSPQQKPTPGSLVKCWGAERAHIDTL